MNTFVKSGLFGKEVSRWLAAGPGEWRGIVFIIGAILFVIIMSGYWKENKLLVIILDIVFGILFGPVTAVGILAIELVLAYLFNRKPKPKPWPVGDRYSGMQNNDAGNKIQYAGEHALEEFDKLAEEVLERERYNDFHWQMLQCETNDDIMNLYWAWEPTIRNAWEDLHRYDD